MVMKIRRARRWVEADGDVAFVASDVNLWVMDSALFRQAMTDGARRTRSMVLFLDVLRRRRCGHRPWCEFAVLEPTELSGCDFLRSVAIDGDRLQAQLPGLEVGLHDVFDAWRSRAC